MNSTIHLIVQYIKGSALSNEGERPDYIGKVRGSNPLGSKFIQEYKIDIFSLSVI